MNSNKIKEALKKWVQIETWHTNHPNDNQRFHTALHEIFSTLGTGIPIDKFEEVLTELVGEFYPKWEEAHKEKTINTFTLRAECIDSYLSDTQQL